MLQPFIFFLHLVNLSIIFFNVIQSNNSNKPAFLPELELKQQQSIYLSIYLLLYRSVCLSVS